MLNFGLVLCSWISYLSHCWCISRLFKTINKEFRWILIGKWCRSWWRCFSSDRQILIHFCDFQIDEEEFVKRVHQVAANNAPGKDSTRLFQISLPWFRFGKFSGYEFIKISPIILDCMICLWTYDPFFHLAIWWANHHLLFRSQ